MNMILNTDSYKASHFLQYPKNTQFVSSYIESRGGEHTHLVFFGLQMFLQQYLTIPISLQDIDEAEHIFQLHGEPFNRKGWLYILEQHQGYLPIEIQAIEEGTILPLKNVLLQVQNTDPACFWLTSYIETALLRAVWYPSTVATISWLCKQTIAKFLEQTADDNSGLAFKLHDFGARGCSSLETAEIGGVAHLINFKGTDTIAGILAAKKYYAEKMAGFSIPAAEHSTITCWGKDNESAAYANMLAQFAGENKTVAVVSDSYDLWHAIENIWGDELKTSVIDNGGTLVIRPDSGDPVPIVCKTIGLLMAKFGETINSKGYRVLPPYIRVIQGDGVSLTMIGKILQAMKEKQLSADNIAFGMGGELLQKVNRDTFQFAMKASATCINNQWMDTFKDPVTDNGKRSKKGRLALIKENNQYKTIREKALGNHPNLLSTVFKNGRIISPINFEKIRLNADISTLN